MLQNNIDSEATTRSAADVALQTNINAEANTRAAADTLLSNQIASINTNFSGLQGQIDTLFDLRSRDRKDMKQGVAAAMAMGDAPMPSHEGGVSYLLTGATFRGEFAGSASLMYRLNARSPMALQVGAAFAGNKNAGARIGLAGFRQGRAAPDRAAGHSPSVGEARHSITGPAPPRCQVIGGRSGLPEREPAWLPERCHSRDRGARRFQLDASANNKSARPHRDRASPVSGAARRRIRCGY